MKPLIEFPSSAARQIEYLFCDIDDTVTTQGRLTAAAYQAMEDLAGDGIQVIPITGRPAGWCDHIARMWPVHAVVGENGAFYLRYDHTARKMRQRDWADPATRVANRQRLDALAGRILAAVPGCALASDQPYRVADLAIDFCEDVPALPEAAVNQIVALFEAAGAKAKVSSIHVNGWFGDYDKLSMTRWLAEDLFGEPLQQMQRQSLFIGDSANDAPLFSFFKQSVGVANVVAQLHRMATPPAYVCQREAGEGFEEMARHLLALRQGSHKPTA